MPERDCSDEYMDAFFKASAEQGNEVVWEIINYHPNDDSSQATELHSISSHPETDLSVMDDEYSYGNEDEDAVSLSERDCLAADPVTATEAILDDEYDEYW